MKLQKILCFLCGVMLVTSAFGIHTSASSIGPVPSNLKFIDNDALTSSGYWNSRTGFDEYIEGTSLYNEDARVNSRGAIGCYDYKHNDVNLGQDFSFLVGAHLNHARFRDPAAIYCIITSDGLIPIDTLNQNDAPGGWNYLPLRKKSTTARVFAQGVRLASSKRDSTGADAISVQYWKY
jgi:hypothetical protein